ncbi:MAG: NAD+ synthase [Desulfobulbaceae bacterium]|nr:NAD+ synthase [Desulfobulbaceae bacterium]
MKIALIQTNPTIGDFAANTARIVARIEHAKARGCELAILPELAMSGYPPLDLLEREPFLADHHRAVARLVAEVRGIGVICGVICRHTAATGKPLHNSAILFADGEILTTAHKRLLPTYDVFDETRYFEPGQGGSLFTFRGLRLGITICEDIWNDKDLFPRRLYACDPAADLFATPETRPDLLINIAASPFQMGKSATRQAIFTNLCRKYTVPFCYVNQVGGQDSLLFDGNSLAMDGAGREIARGAAFAEDLVVVDTEGWQGEIRAATADDTATLFAALVMGSRDYVKKCGFGKGLLGLSGGIDSALTAAIAASALGPQNVLGVALPSPYTSQASIDDARALAENLGIDFTILPITDLFHAYNTTLTPLFAGLAADVTEQNIQARIRGNLLMALSNKFGHLLLSTGNKSEMAVGYCTLYGDMSGGLAVISDVPKGLVYELARYVNREREIIPWSTIDRAPSAELAPDQKDQDDLPPYEILDRIVAAHLEENRSMAEIVAMGFAPEVVADIIRRIRINEYKRKQAPMGLKVTTKAFGPGRRYPNAHNYREEA